MNDKGRYYNWMVTKFPKNQDTDFWKLFWDEIESFRLSNEKLVFMVYQLEECPSTGKLHLQGYCEFSEKVSMKWIKEQFKDSTLHCEQRKGTQKQAIDYCTKIETRVDDTYPIWYGKQKSPGNRSDLDSMVDAIENGMTGREILLQFRGNALRHMNMIYRGLEAYHRLNSIDNGIEMMRPEEPCLEVDGNTINRPPPHDDNWDGH